MLAACGLTRSKSFASREWLQIGDELTAPGKPLAPERLHDAEWRYTVAASIVEAGGDAISTGAFPDDEKVLTKALGDAVCECDMVVLSGGTSKGAGDFSHRIVSQLGKVLVHGVALKPGKPLCLAIAEGKPVVVLPGFPTSAIFTFHAFVAPLIRAWAAC